MADSNTGETSRFKIKHIVPVTNVESTTAAITAIMMIIRPCSLLQHKKLTNTRRRKIRGREKRDQNLRHQIQGILPL